MGREGVEEMSDLFPTLQRSPSKKSLHHKETLRLKKEHDIYTHNAPGAGEWMAFSMSECVAALSGYPLTEEEKTVPVALLTGYCRLMDEARLVEDGHKTEWAAVEALVCRILKSKWTLTGEDSDA